MKLCCRVILRNLCFSMSLAGFILATFVNQSYADQRIIDVHSHFIPSEYMEYLTKNNALMVEGYPIPKYDVQSHLKFIEKAGISLSVLTLPAPHPMFGKNGEDIVKVRNFNIAASKQKEASARNIMFCAILPLPNVNAACDEAKYAINTLHADGIKLATNTNGQYLGSPELDPLMETLNNLKAVVILHPHCPTPISKSVMEQTPLAMQEYLAETTRAVCNMISRNIPARYPNIRFVIPHCGAYLPLAIPRMRSLAPVMKKNGLIGDIDFDANLKSFYYDLAGAPTHLAIKSLLTITTPDHLLYGSDYPYVASNVIISGISNLKKLIRDIPEIAPYEDDIFYGNAASLFSIKHKGNKNMHTSDLANKVNDDERIVRIAKITVKPEFLTEYLTFASECGKESMSKESGVLLMYSMAEKEKPNKITILEIYASQSAYEEHLRTSHFQKYKQGTLNMVDKLELSTQTPLIPDMKIKQ